MLKSTDQYLNLKIRIIIEEIDYSISEFSSLLRSRFLSGAFCVSNPIFLCAKI